MRSAAPETPGQGGHRVPPLQGGARARVPGRPRSRDARRHGRPEPRRAGCHSSASDRALCPRFPFTPATARVGVRAAGRWGPVTPWSARPRVAAVVRPCGPLCHQEVFLHRLSGCIQPPGVWLPQGPSGRTDPRRRPPGPPTCLLPEAPRVSSRLFPVGSLRLLRGRWAPRWAGNGRIALGDKSAFTGEHPAQGCHPP